ASLLLLLYRVFSRIGRRPSRLPGFYIPASVLITTYSAQFFFKLVQYWTDPLSKSAYCGDYADLQPARRSPAGELTRAHNHSIVDKAIQ
ncbi:MAG: hypothetical protein L0220_05665, partial [Acidobacteria bacterium]|nr:hypothetical protein [Acidobacteriota bacterium]